MSSLSNDLRLVVNFLQGIDHLSIVLTSKIIVKANAIKASAFSHLIGPYKIADTIDWDCCLWPGRASRSLF